MLVPSKTLVVTTRILIIPIIAIALITSFISCDKGEVDPSPTGGLSYSNGSNVIYLKSQGSNIVFPDVRRNGEYTAWPEGIEIDDNTGAIDISDSETGLKYKITYKAPNGDTSSTIVLLSGITFTDQFYNLSQNDSVANPVYNADPSKPLPVAGSIFDEGNLANISGCAVKTNNGKINLAETVRNGLFGSVPQNDERKDIEIQYRLNDGSGKALNKLKVRLYYYHTMANVPQDLWETLNDRQSQGVFLRTTGNSPNGFRGVGTAAAAKPRPPCVIIIGQ